MQQEWNGRQQRLRSHHRALLDSVRNTETQAVNAPGFPKAGHEKNPTSTFVKPDMMISAFTAGLTTQQALLEMVIPGFPGALFGHPLGNIPTHMPSANETRSPPNFNDTRHSECLSPVVASLLNSFNQNARSPMNAASSSFTSMPQERGGNQNQKMRKPFFMPYICPENVMRGLRNGDLIKGVLRVNQRNFEESYIDNPEGDDRQDIMILGVHDRNRALHGDVVVVRLKERNHWIVRDSLYEAWRSGHLKVPCDDDGCPLTIPPIKQQDEDTDEKVKLAQAIDFLPAAQQAKIDKDRLKDPVPFPKNKRYSQEMLLRLAAQLEIHRIQQESKIPAQLKRTDNGNGDRRAMSVATPVELDTKSLTQISRLSITRNPKFSSQNADGSNLNGGSLSNNVSPAAQGSFSNARRGTGFHNANTLQRRLNYRMLTDMPDEDWGIPDVCLQKTAEVVYISEPKNCRTAVGQLKVMADENHNWGLFSPNDSRIPRMIIPAEELPDGFFERPHDFSKFIFIAHLVEWQATAQFARGKLYKSLGTAGDIDGETEGLLIANDIDTREFSVSSLSSLPLVDGQPWTIDEKEFKYRRDFRSETLFTIDPSTARDLDDALHIKPIKDCDGKGTPGFEMGVHIADVSYFVQHNTELDKWAENRATSVYLVHKVIPMLPRILCEDLCSLNSGVDRLTFSVVWKMDDEGNIKDEWFGRSIIHNCVKLAYDHAQDIIENPDKQLDISELPTIYNGKTVDQIRESVLNLNHIAKQLKLRRISAGSLRLDAIKLKFALNKETGLPLAVGSEDRKEANFLVEEFMLLANMAVAKHIEKHYPDIALLRRHPPPKVKVLREMAEKCELLQYPIDVEDSHSIARSLNEYYNDKRLRLSVFPVLVQFMMRCMQLAVYFCAATQKSYHHYALSVPYYTHFTSPIRRYPDIIVHRLLSASLGYTPPPEYTVSEMEKICVRCNDRKTNAKSVSEQSAEMFFSLFVREIGHLETLGVVVGVLDAAVDVYLIKYGLVKRIYTNRLKLARDSRFLEGTPGALILYWDPVFVAQTRKNRMKRSSESAVTTKSGTTTSDTSNEQNSGLEMSEIDYELADSDQEIEKVGVEGTESDSEGSEDWEDDKMEQSYGANVALEQTLTVFSVVRLMLSASNEPVKFVGTIVPTPDKYPIRHREIKKLLS